MLTSTAKLVPTRLLAFMAAACVFSATAVRAAEPAGTNEVTAASIFQDIRNEIHDYHKVQTATLLIVVSLEDARPVYIDHALLVLQFPKGKWTLIHALRAAKPSPVTPLWDPKWRPATVTDSPRRFNRPFDHPPTRGEVQQFLHDNQFQLESDRHHRVVERAVYIDAWETALGYRSELKSLERSSAATPADKNVGGTKHVAAEKHP